jgi:glycosyltransferase involved in cell wall biosynthesis
MNENKRPFSNPVISVVTVVFNAKDLIELTIQSVLSQTYKNIDYIIIDGGSKDGTVDIIKKYDNRINYWISESDSGIYDAMNKGISHAKGDYIYFLNAGDTIYSNTTMGDIFKDSYDADVYYGKTCLINIDGSIRKTTKIPEKLTWKKMWKGMLISHQSIVFKRSIIENYNQHYKYISDYDYIIKCLKRSKTIVNTNQIMSNYLLGGVSERKILPCWQERLQIVKKHYNVIFLILNYFLYVTALVKLKVKKRYS